MRRAGRELLSLALIDARNRTLRWLSAFDGAHVVALRTEFDPPLWLVGHVAWFQECAIARNLRRALGQAGAATLASIEPRADAWFDPTISTREQRWRDTDVADAHLRDYLAATLDATLELLERAPEDDNGLQLFRLALAREDAAAETLAAMAQAAGLGSAAVKELWPIWPSRVRREPLWFGAQRMSLGTPPGGFVPWGEDPAAAARALILPVLSLTIPNVASLAASVERRLSLISGHAPQPSQPGLPFDVTLAVSGKTIRVGEQQSLLEAIEAAGVDPPYLCRGGVCGQCETNVISYDGKFIHNDHWLSEEDHRSGCKIMPCVSRFEGRSLVLER